MSNIETYLNYILNKIFARDVRTAIVNAIRQCYDDVHNPTLNTEALQAAIQAKIDAGQMAALTIGDRTITAAKLALGVIPTPDTTLSQSGVPADAKKTGDEITAINESLENVQADLGVINLVKDCYINTSPTPINLTPSPSSVSRMCAVVDCSQGDKFVINAYSDSPVARAWCFIDNTNNVLSMADANVTVTDLELTAPTNAVKLIINDISGGMSYKVGNNLATKAWSGFPSEAKDVLLVILKKVAFVDGNGDNHIRNMAAALGLTKIPLLLYEASEGLPGAVEGITTETTGGTNEQISGNELIVRIDKGTSGTNYIRYNFDSNLLEDYGEISIEARFNPAAYMMDAIYQDGVSIRIVTQAGAIITNICDNGNGKARIIYYVSENEKRYIDTNYDLQDYHKYCLKMESATLHKFEIDGETILDSVFSTGPSVPSTTGVSISAAQTTTDGVTVNIRRIRLYGYID